MCELCWVGCLATRSLTYVSGYGDNYILCDVHRRCVGLAEFVVWIGVAVLFDVERGGNLCWGLKISPRHFFIARPRQRGCLGYSVKLIIVISMIK